MPKIDPVTADRIRQVLTQCRARGLDPVPVLDAAQLLDHQAKRNLWSSIVLQEVAADLRSGSLNTLINRQSYRTPGDMKNEIIRLIEEVAHQWSGNDGRQDNPRKEGSHGP